MTITVNTPFKYKQQPPGTVSLYNQHYIGKVKDNKDDTGQNRFRVYIPEITIGSLESDDKCWVWVRQCLPFSGATSRTSSDQLATSYGTSIPMPNINNFVLVVFVNGDPNNGYSLGSVLQIGQNASVPTGSFSANDPSTYATGTRNVAAISSGTASDNALGISTSSGATTSPNNLYGVRTPNGFCHYIDENINIYKIVTPNGTQIVLNDSNNTIDMRTGNGNSYIQISDAGIKIYSSENIACRSEKNYDLHVDGDFNLHVAGNYNKYIGGTMTSVITNTMQTQVNAGYSLNVNNDIKINTQTNLNLNCTNQMRLTSNDSMNIAGSYTNIQADGLISLLAGSIVSSPQVTQGNAQSATVAVTPNNITLSSNQALDSILISGLGVVSGTTSSICTNLSSRGSNDIYNTSYGPSNNSKPNFTPSIADTGPLLTTAPYPKTTIPIPTPPVQISSTTRNINTPQSIMDAINAAHIQSILPPGYENGNTTLKTPIPPLVVNSYNGTNDPITPQNDNSYILPVNGTVSSLYGARGSGFHRGLDIAAPQNTPIVASKSGIITFCGPNGSPTTGYGNLIVINHNDGTSTAYGHWLNTAKNISVGTNVNQGQTIAYVDKQGDATGYHVHFEIRVGNLLINPSKVFTNITSTGQSTNTSMTSSIKPATNMQ